MFTISEIAAEKAKQVLEAEGKAEWGLRIYTAGGGCCGPAYGMDVEETPQAGDEVVEKNGLRVFADQQTFQNLTGMEMDFVDDGVNQGFVIKGQNPEPPSCGCAGGSCG
ncbi:MAG: iron-sulfur cluster assembly accessory protein [Nitrospirota bacterium]|jgi:iron-sulfur cluster assembly accessory protein